MGQKFTRKWDKNLLENGTQIDWKIRHKLTRKWDKILLENWTKN